jgi:pyruvate/2-oxoglutarate dehydrogenase complex dihydrolipoamide acyltransferase (E2) component
MPQLGETVVEGTITKWLKNEGDSIEEDELLVEISTDKVDSEVPSSASGVIQKILVPEGETVSVGTALAVIGDESTSSGDGQAAEAGETAGAQQPEEREEAKEKEEVPVGGGMAAEADQGKAAAQAEAPSPEQQDAPKQQEEQRSGAGESAGERAEAPAARTESGNGRADRAAAEGDTSKRGIISPLVRRLADEHNVNLDELEGSGTGGRIRKQDVLRYVEEGKSETARPAAQAEPQPAPRREEAPAASTAGAREELVPWTNIRRRTAEHMVASHMETARAWNAVEVDWTDVVELRTAAKESFRKKEGFNLTYLPFLARAVCETLLEMPVVNSTYDGENESTIVKHYVNLGIAVALEGGGLIVPVVKGADEKNLTGLARAVNDIATRARSKKLSPDDLVGGTFTITNPGPFGSVMSVPIIPRGQTAILAFEAIQKRVVVTDDDAIAIRSMGFLPLSWDHRTIDGAEAAQFLKSLRERIERTDWSSELSAYL